MILCETLLSILLSMRKSYRKTYLEHADVTPDSNGFLCNHIFFDKLVSHESKWSISLLDLGFVLTKSISDSLELRSIGMSCSFVSNSLNSLASLALTTTAMPSLGTLGRYMKRSIGTDHNNTEPMDRVRRLRARASAA